jgi:hypothetical protein
LGLDRYRVSGDSHQYRLVLVSGDTFPSSAADTGLASGGQVDATGIGQILFAVARVTQRTACAPVTSQHVVYCRLSRLEKFVAGLQVQRLR